MSGGIWFVQIVHYPLFALVADQALGRYEKKHVLRTGWVVGPLMVAEGLTPFWLAAMPPAEFGRFVRGAGVALLIGIWCSTWFLQVPAHARLEQVFEEPVHRRLVRTNWLRRIGTTT